MRIYIIQYKGKRARNWQLFLRKFETNKKTADDICHDYVNAPTLKFLYDYRVVSVEVPKQ